MSDLISRSALIEKFKNSGILDSVDDAWVYSFAIAIIENQPTAYDVDKVVKELEDYQMWKEFMVYDLTYREREIIRKAIEIVKGGGVNERD